MILVKTPQGQQVLKDRSVPLTPAQRAAFILVDGRRSADTILQSTQAGGVTAEDISRLLALGLVTVMREYDDAPTVPAALLPSTDRASPPERYAAAYPIAVQLTSGLGLRGLRLNLAVEAARDYEELLALAPRIKETVGDERFEPLRKALKG